MYFYYYLPFGKGLALYLNLFYQGILCAKFDWNWPSNSEKIYESLQFIFIISQLSPLWEGRGLSFVPTWFHYTEGYFVPSSVEIGPVILENGNVKSLQTDGQTDDGWQVIKLKNFLKP